MKLLIKMNRSLHFQKEIWDNSCFLAGAISRMSCWVWCQDKRQCVQTETHEIPSECKEVLVVVVVVAALGELLKRGCGVSVCEDTQPHLDTLSTTLLKQEVGSGDLRRSLPAWIWEFGDDLWFKLNLCLCYLMHVTCIAYNAGFPQSARTY